MRIAITATSSMLFHHYDPQLIVEALKDEVSSYPRLWGVYSTIISAGRTTPR